MKVTVANMIQRLLQVWVQEMHLTLCICGTILHTLVDWNHLILISNPKVLTIKKTFTKQLGTITQSMTLSMVFQ